MIYATLSMRWMEDHSE
jgi:phospholipid-transporting ATPase